MELRNIATFCKIAHLKSFCRAAEELGYAQSTITTQIQMLEQELQIKLFERVGRRMELTEKGMIFLKYAENMINLSNEAKEVVNDNDVPKGVLRIGIVESLCTIRLPEVLKIYHASYPEVEIIIKLGVCSDLRNMLKNNMVDLMFILDKPIDEKDFILCMAFEEPMVFLASPENKLTGKNKIYIKDIKNEPLILTEKGCSYRNVFEEMFKKEGLKPHVSLEVGSIEAIKTFTMGNLGITLLPAMTVTDELKSKKLIALNLGKDKFNMVTQVFYHKNKWLNTAMKAFIACLKKNF
ncbi:transcriptional regulator, LysR family [Clostridium acidisoli DSM 12555]|uniref:Transcriptional regulator, LysR family n=1 Tax=Clostridium acidisoli DSM 12555 TaxID=1121291 RepID=A0A1W1XZZ2_9CLOT|nr:LysR family transcriptional regulator [Clostridium acidisoli]SMC29483.1 transcriptional regulator, LysR family [Clostridium acidisoli DSM 12555]